MYAATALLATFAVCCTAADSGSWALTAGRWSPVELSELWDPTTLASFSISQLSAFGQIVHGRCPLLSRAVKCMAHGGEMQTRQNGGQPAQRWRDLITSYLEEETELSRRQTVHMLRHVWTNYETSAFGKDELKPVEGVGIDSWGGLGQLIIDSLDTLWIMGFSSEFDRAADWVETKFELGFDVSVNTFETSIRQLGGLLSAYSLSGRKSLLDKAKDLGERLFVAFRLVRPADKIAVLMKASKNQIGPLVDALNEMGVERSAMAGLISAVGIKNIDVSEVASLVPARLPFSDVNLKTGTVENLGDSVSLSEAYVPIEWKTLSLFTGNCTYATMQDEVLRLLSKTSDLTVRGLAPIKLQADGKIAKTPDNRISLGSRGDSFYEYLLKDILFSGEDVDPLTETLWATFRKMLPRLLVMSKTPAALASKKTNKRAKRSRQFSQRRMLGRKRKSMLTDRKPKEPLIWQLTNTTPDSPLKHLAQGGRHGGWMESYEDAALPWVFVKEMTQKISIPKIDHLVCFLPGSLALAVLHHGGVVPGDDEVRGEHLRVNGSFLLNLSSVPGDRVQELGLAHKLMQTCVHMYFRTASDLAPEITRFNAFGLADDRRSMHNILRPETVESLLMMWRATKAQIYRNWGQRILSAFSRRKTDFGYTGLNNVNKPLDDEVLDQMPSYFVAETVKYLYLLFSPDSALSLHDNILNTEAHPMPVIAKAKHAQWLCRDVK